MFYSKFKRKSAKYCACATVGLCHETGSGCSPLRTLQKLFFFVVVIFFVLVVQQFFGGVMFLWIAGVFCEVLCWFYCSCWVFVSSDGFMFSTLGPLYFTHDKVCYRETLKPKFSPAGSVCASHDNLVGNGVSVWNVCMCVSWKRKTLWSSLWKFKKCCWAAVC